MIINFGLFSTFSNMSITKDATLLIDIIYLISTYENVIDIIFLFLKFRDILNIYLIIFIVIFLFISFLLLK